MDRAVRGLSSGYVAPDRRNAVASQPHWEAFCRALGWYEWIRRFADNVARRDDRAVLEGLVEDEFAHRDSEALFAMLEAVGLPHGRVRGIAEVLAHPQVAARRLVRTIASEVGYLPTVESALRMSDSPVAEGALPTYGDTRAVLREAGYTDEELDELVREEAVWTSE